MTFAAPRTRSFHRVVGSISLVVSSLVVVSVDIALIPRAAWACSAPAKSDTPDIRYEGVVIRPAWSPAPVQVNESAHAGEFNKRRAQIRCLDAAKEDLDHLRLRAP